MNINKLIIDTLKPLAIPTSFQVYTGIARPYITFFEYSDPSESFADNQETSIGHYIQIDLFSKTDYTDVFASAKNLLKAAGFMRKPGTEFYETETLLYHKVIRVLFIEEL